MPPLSLNEILADLLDAFPRQPCGPNTVRQYQDHLSDLPVEKVALAVQDLIRTSRFLPTIAEIRHEVAERILALPTEDEALSQIERRIAWASTDGNVDTRPDVHPLVKEALDHIGGFVALRTSDNPGIQRSQFTKLYTSMRERSVVDAQRNMKEIER